jgi:hypothetical protein
MMKRVEAVGANLTLVGQAVRLRLFRDDDLDRLEAILSEPSLARWWGPRTPAGLAAD